MDVSDKQPPNLTEKALAEKRRREERQARALRANLRRRREHDAAPEVGRNEKDGAHG